MALTVNSVVEQTLPKSKNRKNCGRTAKQFVMARHTHSRRSSEDREYVSMSHSRTMTRLDLEQNRLPSLSEVR